MTNPTDTQSPAAQTPDSQTPNALSLNGQSLSISDQRRQELKQLFPGVFTETRNDQGDLVQAIDFERLKAELGEFSDLYDNHRERYGMDWPGKRDCLKVIQQPSLATLKPCREESVEFDASQNLFIEGDNLEVLKLLQKSYYGAVKMIYIDPPYNTGKEFIYPDNYAESLDTYLKYAGLKDSDGKKFTSKNSGNEGRFHTNWLNMMYPRLYLARNLLREDGVIFISIDDNEVENLRRLCDEIFGEENFIASVIWQRRTSPDPRKPLGSAHDYILVYAKSEVGTAAIKKLPLSEARTSDYKNLDNDARGLWASVDLTGQSGHATEDQFFKVTTPSGAEYFPPEGRCWALAESTFQQLVSDNRIWFGKNRDSRPRLKKFLSESDGGTCWTWWPGSEVGNNQNSAKELKALFGASDIFENPKPTSLLTRILDLTIDDGDIVLDFFAGSGSLGQSIFKCEKQVSFILIQLPEKIENKSPAFQFCSELKQPELISTLSKERLRRAGAKLKAEQSTQLDLESNPEHQPDLGFKVFKLDRSNFKQWQAPSSAVSDGDLLQQMELSIDPVLADATPEQMLYEILLKIGLPLTAEVTTIELAGMPVYSVEDGSVLIFLLGQMHQALIDAVLDAAPGQFICLDKAFEGNDQLKANAVKTFAHYNAGFDSDAERIDFRTL